MKYRSYILFLNTVLTYHFSMKYQYFVREKSSFGMLKWYLRIVCKIGISYCFRYEILIQFYLGIITTYTLNERIYKKTFNISRNVSNVTLLFIEINVEIMKLSADMHLITEHFVWERIFAIYQMGTHGLPIFKWVTHGRPMQRSAFGQVYNSSYLLFWTIWSPEDAAKKTCSLGFTRERGHFEHELRDNPSIIFKTTLG
jgi:hypothetical protein